MFAGLVTLVLAYAKILKRLNEDFDQSICDTSNRAANLHLNGNTVLSFSVAAVSSVLPGVPVALLTHCCHVAWPSFSSTCHHY